MPTISETIKRKLRRRIGTPELLIHFIVVSARPLPSEIVLYPAASSASYSVQAILGDWRE
jgi:hypothetical protein